MKLVFLLGRVFLFVLNTNINVYVYTCYYVRHRLSSPLSFPSHLNWKKQGPGFSALGMEDSEIQVLRSSGSFQSQT